MEQNTREVENVNNIYHGDPALHQRIQQLIRESEEPEFTLFLNQLGNALWNGQINDTTAEEDLNKNHAIYQAKRQQQSVVRDIEKPVETPKKSVEFAVGAGILGVTGAIFLLAAFWLFAMNFMSNLAKGLSFYGILLLVILVSELWVRKKQEKFSVGMTGVGLSGLFLNTLVIHGYGILNNVLAFVLIALITAMTFFLSYKKDSGVLRIIALLGSVICLFPLMEYDKLPTYLETGVMVLMIQIVAAFVPTKKEQKAIWVLQMIMQAASVFLYGFNANWCGLSSEWVAVFMVLMIALLNLLFLRAKVYIGSVIVFCLVYFFNIFMLPLSDLEGWKLYGFIFVPFAVVTAVFTVLLKHKVCRWIPYWFYQFLVVYIWIKEEVDMFTWSGFAVVTMLYITAKVLSRVKELRVNECVITIGVFFYLLGITTERCGGENIRIAMILILISVFILSIFFTKHWHAFYELVITFSAIAGALKLCPDVVKLPVVTGILVFGMFLFAFIKGKQLVSMRVYNIFSLCMLVACYFKLAFLDNLLIYIIMLLYGITVLLLVLDERYALTDKNKYLWLGIFLTYMFLILDVKYAIINSILLIVTAILCVGAGFAAKQKAARIYGLVLAILATLKVAVFDVSGREALVRMTAFLIVGILILVISYIYILLEKKISQEKPR